MDQTEEALRKKLSAHKLILSPIGFLKIITIILFLVGSILSLSFEVCSQYNAGLQLAFPIVTVTNGVLVAVLYVSAALGLAKKIPRIWFKLDIGACVVFATSTIILSIFTMANCTGSGGITIVPGILGIIGSLSLFIAAAASFVAWQNAKSKAIDAAEMTRSQAAASAASDPKRKSVMI